MATITIPAAYVETARQAIFKELLEDAEALQSADVEDRIGNGVILSRDCRLLDQLLHANGDTPVESVDGDRVSNPIIDMLENMVRLTVGELDRECVYAPLPVAEVMALMDRIRWATGEIVRLSEAQAVV